MTLFVCMPVSFPGMFFTHTAWNHHDPSPFFQPAYKFIIVIHLYLPEWTFCLNQAAPAVSAPYRYRYASRRKAKIAMDIQVHLSPHGLSLSILPRCARFLRGIPFFGPTGMMLYFHCCIVQHDPQRTRELTVLGDTN